METGHLTNTDLIDACGDLPDEPKTMCDPVHGHITLHPVWVALIDTPQFQRLRYICQTGFCDYVFPGAKHDRFGHSIGVAYLAGCFLRQIRDRQPKLQISDTEILCVELAGLCHDLGHGPFSHVWEGVLNHNDENIHFKHEVVSLNMLDYLIEDNDLKPFLRKWNIGDAEINTIKMMICGDKGRNKSRTFLYQIVNNNQSGLDVDKWDYFLRDCHFCGSHCTFDYSRLLHFARVKEVENQMQICFRDKEASNVLNVFRTRSMLHHQVYQHRVVRLIHTLFEKALIMVKDELRVGPDQKPFKIFEWSVQALKPKSGVVDNEFHHRMSNYCQLTDSSVISAVLQSNSNSPLVSEAQSILQSFRLGRGFKDLYHWVGKTTLHDHISQDAVMEGILKHIPENVLKNTDFRKLILIQVVVIHWGKGLLNPVSFVNFYSKDAQLKAMPLNEMQSSLDLPRSFQEVEIRIYCKHSPQEPTFQLISNSFTKFSAEISSQT